MIDGIYIAYFAGRTGTSMGMFVFKDGKIAGGDIGGWVYQGNYAIEQGGMAVGTIRFEMAKGTSSITGASAGDEPVRVDVPIRLPVALDPSETYRIETPIGPLNAKFRRVADL